MLEKIAKEYSEYVRKKYYRFSSKKKWNIISDKKGDSYEFGFDEHNKPFFFMDNLPGSDIIRLNYGFKRESFGFLDPIRKKPTQIIERFPEFLRTNGYDFIVCSAARIYGTKALQATGNKSEELLFAFSFLERELNLYFQYSHQFHSQIERFGQPGSEFDFFVKEDKIEIYQNSPVPMMIGNVKSFHEADYFVRFIKSEQLKMKKAEIMLLRELNNLGIHYSFDQMNNNLYLLGLTVGFVIRNKGKFYTSAFQAYVHNEDDFDTLLEKTRKSIIKYAKEHRLRGVANGKNLPAVR